MEVSPRGARGLRAAGAAGAQGGLRLAGCGAPARGGLSSPPRLPPGAPTSPLSPTAESAAPRLGKALVFSGFPSLFKFPPEEKLPAAGTLAGLALPAACRCIFLAAAPNASLKTSFQTSQTFLRKIAMEEPNVGANGGLYL